MSVLLQGGNGLPDAPPAQEQPTERVGGENHAERVAGFPRDMIGPLRCVVGPVELATVSKRLSELAQVLDGEVGRCTEPLPLPPTDQQRVGPRQEIFGTAQLAEPIVGAAELVACDPLNRDIAQTCADVEGSQTGGDGRLGLAFKKVVAGEERRDATERRLISQALGERLGLSQVLESPTRLPQGREGAAESQPDFNPVREGVSRLWQMLQSEEGALQNHRRLAVRRALHRLVSRLQTVFEGLLPRLTFQRVVCKSLGMLQQPPPILLLNAADDASMQFPTRILQEAPVYHFVRKRMLEGVGGLGGRADLVEQLGRLELGESPPKAVLWHVRDGLQEREWHVLPDDGGGLKEALVFGWQPVNPGSQDRLHRGGHLHADHRLCQPIRTVLANENVRLDQCPHALLQEERVALGPLDQYPRERLQGPVLAQ